MLEFRILGPLEVVGETGSIALGGQKQRALLGLLLLRAGEVVSADRLVDELWGEHPPKTATTSLHNLVAQLRKLLGPEALVTRPPGYLLRVEAGQLDSARFEQLVVEARRAEPGERARRLREALALWRGSPLGDIAFEAFAQPEIRRLEELRLEATEERIDADLELGAGAELVGELEVLVEQHPLRERLRGQLMLALYRAGRQAESLQAYHDGRQVLVEELGIEPSPALQQLYTSILRQEAVLQPAAPPRPVDDHYLELVKTMLAGRLVVVLGAAVNVGGDDASTLPGLTEVAAYLAECFDCPPERRGDLASVSQYVALMKGVGPLYDELHDLLDRDYSPAPTHRLLAELARLLGQRGAPRQLIVTANFDQALERAFTEAGEEFDLVSYIALGRHQGKFLHVSADGQVRVVDVPNTYAGLSPEHRTIILKIHGQVDSRPEREWESFVVSEDDYIEYLAQTDIASVVPVGLVAKLRRSHFLFLGYPLRDWHLRVFLHRLWGREKVSYRSWSIEPQPDPLERESWRQRGIEVFDVDLDEYLAQVKRLLAEGVPA